MVTKIMPLGDSNTYGMYQNQASPGGYRGPLQAMLNGRNLSFDLVGEDRDGRIADPDHNGYSGKTIDWFTRPVDEVIRNRDGSYSHTVDSGSKTAIRHFLDEAGMTPSDVVLLCLGTNDVRLGDSASAMLAQMDALLNQIVSHASSPMIQLMKVPPVRGDLWKNDGDTSRTTNDTINQFNSGLEKLVADKYATRGVTLIDNGLATADLSPDGVHISEAGHRKMASAWFDSLLAEDQLDFRSVTPPAPPVVGSGPDTLTVRVSGEAYQGGANFALTLNGKVIDATNLVTADRSEGAWQTFTFEGAFVTPGSTAYKVGVQFTNDLYKAGVGDRNLYVDEVSLNGVTNGTDRTFLSEGTRTWDLTGVKPAGTTAPEPAPGTGTGLDTITVRASGDAWKGDPNFALLVNGRVIDATNLVTADRAENEWETFVFRGDFDLDGSDRVGVRFTQDSYDGPGKDRNLYVDKVTANGEVNHMNQTFLRAGTEYWDI